MANQLFNILVPVDFTRKNQWALAKAIELSNYFHCNIHLVYITGSRDSVFSRNVSAERAFRKLLRIKSNCIKQLCGEGNIELSILHGKKTEQLIGYIRKYGIDLVITGLPGNNIIRRLILSIRISQLAKRTTIPVLAVKASGLICHFKKIVLPVDKEIPFSQVRLATLLGRAFKSTVYFVSMRNTADGHQKKILDATLDLLRSISTIPFQCILLEGKNLAGSTLEFSRKINADLIFINPIRDISIRNFFTRLFNNLLPFRSRIPVVTIAEKK